ncbi:MAG: MFS transporter [Gemmatimonadota bacterium]
MEKVKRREVFSWALYDFANSAFTTVIVTFVFSRFYAEIIAGDPTRGAVWWTYAVNTSAIIVALIMPILGAVADFSARKKIFLLAVTVESILFTVLLFFMGPGDALIAAVLFVFANVGFEAAQVFYNGFLPEISERTTMGRVSGWGWGLGYVGGLLCLALALGMYELWLPAENNLNVRSVTLLVAGWWAVFSIPMFAWVKERAEPQAADVEGYVVTGFRRVVRTFREIRTFKEAAKLLLARLIYNDGLTTIFVMAAIYVSAVFGMDTGDVIMMGILINVAAGVGAFGFGYVDDWIGGKATIVISLLLLSVGTILGSTTSSTTGFWIAAVLIGLMVGPNQSASRSLLGRFVPDTKQAEFFGFFAFSGKLSSVAGPFAYGSILTLSDSHRIAMGSILAFFLVGMVIVLTVDERTGMAAADAYDARVEAEAVQG